jgi:uncharacterized membrane protein YkvA (DUF1232 family)
VLNWLRAQARALKRDIGALQRAIRDPRVPLSAKIVGGLTVAYALSPIDLIPDFIPVLGFLDDLIIVPAGLWLAISLIPPEVLAEHRAAAATVPCSPKPATAWAAAAAIIGLWAVAAVLTGRWLMSFGAPLF